MDMIKEKIEEIIKKIIEDKDFASNFKSNPIKAVEGVVGVDLPDDKINSIVDGVKAKLKSEDIKDDVKGLGDKLKGLFK